MAMSASTARAGLRPPSALFPVTVFASAALVFLVQPMVAKLVLPLLGGSPSVWNTSLVFFQAALLVGYGYAHALQRARSVRVQAIVHGMPRAVNRRMSAPHGTPATGALPRSAATAARTVCTHG